MAQALRRELTVPTPPSFDSVEEERLHRKQRLAAALRLFALFGFNFFARTQSQALDHLERLGSRLIDHIRLDEETGEKETIASVTPLAPREGRVKR